VPTAERIVKWRIQRLEGGGRENDADELWLGLYAARPPGVRPPRESFELLGWDAPVGPSRRECAAVRDSRRSGAALSIRACLRSKSSPPAAKEAPMLPFVGG